MFYRIKDNYIYDYSDFEYSTDCLSTNIITRAELEKHPNKVLIKNGKLILNPNFEEEEAEKEKERITKLTCTKRVFTLALQTLGISYAQIKELISTDEQAQLEWELCEKLERSNPLLDIMAQKMGITPQQLDTIFIEVNNGV